MSRLLVEPAAIPPWVGTLISGLGNLGEDIRGRGGGLFRRLASVAPLRQAAVLILITGTFESSELPSDAHVLLTRRSSQLRKHPGQVAFPGGAIDVSDDGPLAAALREAHEEALLDPKAVTPLAQLDSYVVPPSRFEVTPILAYAPTQVPVGPGDPGEVEEVRHVAIADLADPANRFTVSKMGYQGPAFVNGKMLVWGFTGGVLNAVLAAAGWEQNWDRDDVRDLADELYAVSQA